jgi:hypothetical protein
MDIWQKVLFLHQNDRLSVANEGVEKMLTPTPSFFDFPKFSETIF